MVVSGAILSLPNLKRAISTGLPDGIFSNQISQFGSILEGLAMENVR
jgi:hypothetical protein